MKPVHIGIVVVLVAIAFGVATGMRPPARINSVPGKPVVNATGWSKPIPRKEKLAVAFRLDPELTHGMYLGDRWVTPPSYFFAQQGTQYVVQAKAQKIDSRGEHIDLTSDWAPTDPDMVAVTRRKNGEVTIVVRRPGESSMTVSTGDGSKVLHIRATQVGDAMQVAIDQ